MIAYGTELSQPPVQDIQILSINDEFTEPLVKRITNKAYAKVTNMSLDKGEEDTKLTTNSKKTKKIAAKRKSTKKA